MSASGRVKRTLQALALGIALVPTLVIIAFEALEKLRKPPTPPEPR